MASNPLNGVEAFVFDVYGTVVDIHGTIVRELYKTIEKHGLSSGGEFIAVGLLML